MYCSLGATLVCSTTALTGSDGRPIKNADTRMLFAFESIQSREKGGTNY